MQTKLTYWTDKEPDLWSIEKTVIAFAYFRISFEWADPHLIQGRARGLFPEHGMTYWVI